MTAYLSTWIRQKPLLAFYLLAYAITWTGWLPQAAHSRGLFLFDSPLFYLLGGIGPLLAAFIVRSCLSGQADYEGLFQPLLQWRVGLGWYLVALLSYPAMWLAALALSGELPAVTAIAGAPLRLVPVFLICLVAAVPEEVAWRGLVLPRLQARHSALGASLIIGGMSALWHLPLLWNKSNVMSTYPLAAFLLAAIALTVVYTWLFNSTRGSVLLVTLFHAASNSLGPFVGVEQTVVNVLAAAVLVIVFGATHLSRGAGRTVQPDARSSLGTAVDRPHLSRKVDLPWHSY